MKRLLGVSSATVLALAIAIPAFAGGEHCSGSKSTTASAKSYHSKAKSSAWAGAFLQRSTSGEITVAEVAKGSAAARSGLKAGDIVLAVNGYDLANSEDRAMCASKAACSVGSAVTYKVQRGNATKTVKFKLEKMPADAADRFASRQASFDPMLAAVVMPAEIN